MATSIKHKGWKLDADRSYLAALFNSTEAYRITASAVTVALPTTLSSTVAITGAATFTGAILPSVSNTPALGSATLMWADLFLGSAAVINFNNGDVTITHSSNDIAIAGGSLSTAAINASGLITSTSTTGLSFNPTLVPDENRTNYIWSYGTRATAKDLSMAASASYNLDPVQMNLNIIGTAPTSSTVNLSYMKIALPNTAAMTGLRLKCSDWNITIANNILDAYVYQGEIDITASTAVGGEATVLGLTASVSAGTVTGIVRGMGILMSGASMPVATSAGYSLNVGGGATITHGMILATQGGTTMTNAFYFEDGGTITNIFKFAATSAAVVSKSDSAGAQSYTVRCAVGGVTGYIRLFAN